MRGRTTVIIGNWFLPALLILGSARCTHVFVSYPLIDSLDTVMITVLTKRWRRWYYWYGIIFIVGRRSCTFLVPAPFSIQFRRRRCLLWSRIVVKFKFWKYKYERSTTPRRRSNLQYFYRRYRAGLYLGFQDLLFFFFFFSSFFFLFWHFGLNDHIFGSTVPILIRPSSLRSSCCTLPYLELHDSHDSFGVVWLNWVIWLSIPYLWFYCSDFDQTKFPDILMLYSSIFRTSWLTWLICTQLSHLTHSPISLVLLLRFWSDQVFWASRVFALPHENPHISSWLSTLYLQFFCSNFH